MENYAIVRQGHLNHHGYLFGGQLLKWVDEYAWIGASRDFPGYTLVTRAMDKIDFRTPVISGSILRFHTFLAQRGSSSLTYTVEVFADEPGATEEKLVFTNHVVFVSVDAEGQKRPIPETVQPMDMSVRVDDLTRAGRPNDE